MKRPAFDPYQIDTHHAEVLVKCSLENGYSDSFKCENEAFALLQGVIIRRNERYHPFGVFDKMIDLFGKRRTEIGNNSGYCIKILENMTSLTNKFPNELRDRYHIINRVSFRAENSKVVSKMIHHLNRSSFARNSYEPTPTPHTLHPPLYLSALAAEMVAGGAV